jgi:AcrR family transcriptional regulator
MPRPVGSRAVSNTAARRQDSRSRRRAQILDSVEVLYIKDGWAALTVVQVAHNIRLSRALVYLYFHDKEDLLFAIGRRAMRVLRDRLAVAAAEASSGMDQIESISQAYRAYAYEFPHYFDFCSRFQSRSIARDSRFNERACGVAGDRVIGIVVRAVETGIRDGSIRAGIRDPMMFALTLCAFTHKIIQLATAKGAVPARYAFTIAEFTDNAFVLLRRIAKPPGKTSSMAVLTGCRLEPLKTVGRL